MAYEKHHGSEQDAIEEQTHTDTPNSCFLLLRLCVSRLKSRGTLLSSLVMPMPRFTSAPSARVPNAINLTEVTPPTRPAAALLSAQPSWNCFGMRLDPPFLKICLLAGLCSLETDFALFLPFLRSSVFYLRNSLIVCFYDYLVTSHSSIALVRLH